MPTTSFAVPVAILLACACGGAERPATAPLSAAAHLDRARRNEVEAAAHRERAAEARGLERAQGQRPDCLDTLAGVPPPVSGGEALTVVRPCFSGHERPSAAHQAEAARHDAVATAHRQTAERLMEAEASSCRGIGVDERDHSPFFHREDILSVTPVLEQGSVRGAVVRFRAVHGLSVDWMRRAVACHLARAAALGYDPDVMPYCPLMLEGVSAEVRPAGVGVLVEVRATQPGMAQAVLGRAEDLLLDR